MNPTVQLLWDWRVGGRPDDEARDWACRLLEDGYESDAILRLAGGYDFDVDEQRRFIRRAVCEIGMGQLLDEQKLIDAYEAESVDDYLKGTLDGWTLILRGCDLYYMNRDEPRRLFWIVIAEDADECGGQGVCGTYRFDVGEFDQVLRKALVANGFANAACET